MAMILWRSLRNIQAMGRHRGEAKAGEAADTDDRDSHVPRLTRISCWQARRTRRFLRYLSFTARGVMCFMYSTLLLGRKRGNGVYGGWTSRTLAEGSGWSSGPAERPRLLMTQALLRRWEWDLQYTRESD